jgi:hypothetical protein
MQFNLFDEPLPQSTATREVLVRSYLRSVKGAEKPTHPPTRPAQPRKAQRGTDSPASPIKAPHNGTDTSRAAARHIEATGSATTKRDQVLATIRAAGERSITRADVAVQMGYPVSSVCGRVAELRKIGQATETQETRIPDCGGSVRQKVLRAV